MRSLFVLVLVVATVAARGTMMCTHLLIDDVVCEGYRGNFPIKVCAFRGGNMPTSSMFCDLPHVFQVWKNICPLRNLNDTKMFCEGTGFVGPDALHTLPCLGLNECQTHEECNAGMSPASPAPKFTKYCAHCCHRCFDDERCEQKVLDLPWYTNSTDCIPCDVPSTNELQPEGSSTSAPGTSESIFAGDFNIAPWIYAIVAVAVIAFPLLLVGALLFRKKCNKVASARKYGNLEEEAEKCKYVQ